MPLVAKVKGYLLDTTAIIDLLRGNHQLRTTIQQWIEEGLPVTYCPISVCEVYEGMRENESEATGEFFAGFECDAINHEHGRLAGVWVSEYRKKGITVSRLDALVAAVAHLNGRALVTANVKDFPMLEGGELYQH